MKRVELSNDCYMLLPCKMVSKIQLLTISKVIYIYAIVYHFQLRWKICVLVYIVRLLFNVSVITGNALLLLLCTRNQ